MKIKVNDKVQVMAGKDKGKTGKVLQILPDMNKVVAEGINVMYKHLKAKSKTEKGQRVQFNGPVMVSNLMLVCPKCNKPSRLGVKISENIVEDPERERGKDVTKRTKARFCKKCNEVID